MKKFLLISLFLTVLFFACSSSVKDQLFRDMFSPLYDVIDIYNVDYAKISGLYAGAGTLRGSASIGSFPSFRVGSTVGVIFMTNPIQFLKHMEYGGTSWSDIKTDDDFAAMKESFDWFDNYFLPIPVTNFHFEIGLPKNMSIGGNFHVAPIGGFSKAVAPAAAEYFDELFLWGLGVNFHYTIIREKKYLPSLSVGFGVNYSDVHMKFINMPASTVELDATNTVPVSLGFEAHHYNTSFSFDLTISKKISVFQPYLSMKFIQTINYNITSFFISLDLSDASTIIKDLYGDGEFELNNLTVKQEGQEATGDVNPSTEFLLTAGFELCFKIFRLGLEGSYGVVSQRGMLSMGFRFHIEDYHLNNLKTKMNKRKELKDTDE